MEGFVPSSGCSEPEAGRDLEGYVEGHLPPERAAFFERHYLSCPTCLAELELRQALPEALGQAAKEAERASKPGPRGWLWPAFAGAAAAGLLLVAVLATGRSGTDTAIGPPVELKLQEAFRGSGTPPQAPLRRPLVLSLLVPIPGREGVTYAVDVIDPKGNLVFSKAGLAPSGPSEVRLELPKGIGKPGRCAVTLTETIPGETSRLELHFAFEAVEKH